MPTMMGTAPGGVFGTTYPSGVTYTADAGGILRNVAIQDIPALRAGGCEELGVYGGTGSLIGCLIGADMNATTDQLLPLFMGPTVPYRVTKLSVKNASISLTTAAGGVYPAISKGGTALVAAAQVYTALTGNTVALDLTIVAGPGNTVYGPGTLLYLSLTTPQGAAASADVWVYGELMK